MEQFRHFSWDLGDRIRPHSKQDKMFCAWLNLQLWCMCCDEIKWKDRPTCELTKGPHIKKVLVAGFIAETYHETKVTRQLSVSMESQSRSLHTLIAFCKNTCSVIHVQWFPYPAMRAWHKITFTVSDPALLEICPSQIQSLKLHYSSLCL